jgi:hypothetical protein
MGQSNTRALHIHGGDDHHKALGIDRDPANTSSTPVRNLTPPQAPRAPNRKRVASQAQQNGAKNMAVARRFSLNLIRSNTAKGSIKTKRKVAGWDPAFLLPILQPN